jgi:hypothetical protein
VYVRLQQIAKRIINHSMPLYAAGTRESVRDDGDGEVTSAVRCAGMTYV